MHKSPLIDQSKGSTRLCLPPNFFPAGEVTFAEIAPSPPKFKKRSHSTQRQKEGLRYERRAQEYLRACSPSYISCPWLRFIKSKGKPRYCQPDGLHFDFERGVITVVEIKSSHTALAWWQVRHLYGPVVQHLFGSDFTIRALEVVRRFDPSSSFPDEIVRYSSPFCTKVQEDFFGVHIWSGK